MPRKPVDSEPEEELVARRGRRFGDPEAKRSYRYVMRMHPDLAEVLGLLADEAQMSRALFVERILLSFVNQDPRVSLDATGRKIDPNRQRAPAQLSSLASFGKQWRQWQSLRQGVLGEDMPPDIDFPAEALGGQYIDEDGRDERGKPVKGAAALPLRVPGPPVAIPKKNIRTNRGAKPKLK